MMTSARDLPATRCHLVSEQDGPGSAEPRVDITVERPQSAVSVVMNGFSACFSHETCPPTGVRVEPLLVSLVTVERFFTVSVRTLVP